MSWSGTAMALLAMASVGLWTLRVALAAAGRRLAGAAVAAVEAVVFALAFSNLVANLGSWERIAGYAIGVAAGTVAGLAINDRLSQGDTMIEIFVPGDGEGLRSTLHCCGWPVTTMTARGISGGATVLVLVVHTARANEVLKLVRANSPHALMTVRPVKAVHGTTGPTTPIPLSQSGPLCG
jgi:uncharacterized protein YebE (UPF0316 family)